MHAMKISDLVGIQKGLIRVTQSLKKMKETFQLMHSNFLLLLLQHEFNQSICGAFYQGSEIPSRKRTKIVLCPDHVEATAFHGTLRIFVSG